MTRLVLAGSRAAEVEPVAKAVGRVLAAVPEPTVLLRAGNATLPNPFEATVDAACHRLKIRDEWWFPNVFLHKGRRAVWYRDSDMIESADLVVCFYSFHEIGDDTSGTVGLVDKAIGLEVPVYAYAVVSDRYEPPIVRVGEYDEEDRWGSTLAGILGP